jgi:hypothetical protein
MPKNKNPRIVRRGDFFDSTFSGVAVMMPSSEMTFVMFARMAGDLVAVMMFGKARRVRGRDG